jgi:Rrf2 family protein
MLRLSKKADYGLIALMHLALAGEGQSASAKEIADAHSLPLPLLAKVLQKLTKEGFLAAAQGTNGGYRLARLPDSISALEVIRAIDGPVFLTSCSATGADCYKTSKCTARKPLERIREDIFHLLAGITLTEMSSGGRSEPPLVTLKAAGDMQ